MDDVRGDVLGLSHGKTPAAVIVNKIEKLDPLKSMKTLKDRAYVIENKRFLILLNAANLAC